MGASTHSTCRCRADGDADDCFSLTPLVIGDVSETELVQAFQDDAGRGEFIILSQSEQVYLQAGGEEEGPYDLEYRDGDGEHHFRCKTNVSKSEVQAAFVKYLRSDPSWKTDFEWERLEPRPWWKVW